ncbi:MAG: tetratricopeptide repeat protein [Candidatus Odinarchaeia archaeon]
MSAENLFKSVLKNLNAGNIKYALLDLQSLKGMLPNDPRVYYYYGVCYQRGNEHEKAVENFNKSLQLTSDPDPKLYMFLGSSLLQLKDYSKAIENFNLALGKGIAEPAIFYSLAIAYAQIGEKEKAIEAAEKGVRMKPGDADYKKLLEDVKNL